MKKRIALLLAALMLSATVLGACTPKADDPAVKDPSDTPSQTTSKDGEKSELPEVDLEWYLAVPNASMKDTALVLEEFNKITKEEINANVNINFIDFGSYGQQMQMKLSSNSSIDLMYTSNWTNDFYADVARGAYQELDYEKIKEFAPNVIGGVPEGAWDAARVGGKLYAMPNTQVLARWPAIMLRTEFIKKYNFDTTEVKSIDDFTPLFEQIAKNEKGVYPIDVHKNLDVLGFYISKMGYEYFGSTNPLGVKIGDKDLNIVNLYETPEMIAFLNTLRDWYNKGIIRKDAATVTDTAGEIANGMYASMFAVNNPDTLVNQSRNWNCKPEDLTMVTLSDPFLATGSIVATMTAVGQTSKNAERVYMLYNMMYDDNDSRLLNLLNFGIDGTHYKKVADDLIELIPDSGFYIDCGWAYGNIFNSFRTNPNQPAWRPAGPDINNNAIVSDMLGFNMDPTKIKSELAQISSVMGELTPGLMTGSVDVEPALAQLNEKLKKAGMETVQKEIQVQMDAWKASK
ncbi:MAG: ABC transporter substrate-binding protein [Oscillospiraceae bacterium]